MKIGYGSCHGTFGELAQGVVNDQPYLIPLPIKKYSKATFFPKYNELLCGPSNKDKSLLACKTLLRMFHIECGGRLVLESNIPIGKGMASSSADIVASLRAIADSFEIQLTPQIISSIAVLIEPTDAIMYTTIYSYNYLQGRPIERLGDLPDFGLIGIDFGGEIDTIAFNQKPKCYNDDEKQLLKEAYLSIKRGIREKNISLISNGTTLSSIVNQRLLPKPYFNELLMLLKLYKCGITIAHSGTIVGVLLHPSITKKQELDLYKAIKQITKKNPFFIEILHHKENIEEGIPKGN